MYYVVARVLVAWVRAVGVLDHGIAIYQSVLYYPAMNAQRVGGRVSRNSSCFVCGGFKRNAGSTEIIWFGGAGFIDSKDDIHALLCFALRNSAGTKLP
jgi:hypothetical protein